jgi:hypothetical protein
MTTVPNFNRGVVRHGCDERDGLADGAGEAWISWLTSAPRRRNAPGEQLVLHAGDPPLRVSEEPRRDPRRLTCSRPPERGGSVDRTPPLIELRKRHDEVELWVVPLLVPDLERPLGS